MRRLRFAFALFCAATLAACGGDTQQNTIVHARDISPPHFEEASFTKNSELINDDVFRTFSAVQRADQLQEFFNSLPYNERSFLRYYSTNGVSAANAVLNAAIKYKINPLVLLVRLQMTEGLLSMTEYPERSARVEYVFQCGCDGQGECLPDMAGLDKQLECLAAKLDQQWRELELKGATRSDWSVGVSQRTIDGVDVTPPNKASCVLYQLDPVYGEDSQSGAWLFVRILSLYAHALRVNLYPADGNGIAVGSVPLDPQPLSTQP